MRYTPLNKPLASSHFHQHNPDVSDKDIKDGIIEQIIKPVLTPTGLLDENTKYFKEISSLKEWLEEKIYLDK